MENRLFNIGDVVKEIFEGSTGLVFTVEWINYQENALGYFKNGNEEEAISYYFQDVEILAPESSRQGLSSIMSTQPTLISLQ